MYFTTEDDFAIAIARKLQVLLEIVILEVLSDGGCREQGQQGRNDRCGGQRAISRTSIVESGGRIANVIPLDLSCEWRGFVSGCGNPRYVSVSCRRR